MPAFRNFIILVVFFLTCLNCKGQEPVVEKGGSAALTGLDSIETQIAVIRKEYNRINADISKFRVVKEDLVGQSAEGGELIKYYEGESLRKAKLVFYGETGRAMNEFYFLDGAIIFSFKRTYFYEIDNDSTVRKVDEERFYFNKLKLIRWIGPGGKIVKASQYGKKEKEIDQILKDDVYKK